MKTTYIGILLAGILGLSSCSMVGDIDDIKPYYKMESDNVVYNSESAESVLRGVYKSWRTFNVSTFRPYMSILSGTTASKGGGLTGGQEFVTNSIQADNIALSNIYQGTYLTINTANNLIKLMERGDAKGMPEQRVKEIIAECKFHRSLAHFQILRHFGYFFDLNSPYGIVLRNTPFEGTETATRASVQDSYTFILEDLDYAIANAATNSTHHYYITQTSAKALKAKVLLHMGKMAEAEQLAKEVIEEANNYGYKLENTFKSLFENGYESTEALFSTYTHGSLEVVSDLVSRTTYSEYTKRLADNLVNGETDGDLTTGQGYDFRFYFMFNPNSAGPLGNGKYPYASNGAGKHNTQMILRLGEIYLVHAEAAAHNKNYVAARESLQSIASRAGYANDYASTLSDNQLLSFIFKHKTLELFSENGEDWFDFVRYYKAGNIGLGDIKSTIKSESQLVLPIPQVALAGNKELAPNPL
ncbi:RagB/SusD family nutrient uptake outer membrane protein [Sphingobacterium tabacisoli]|uniref:RagB/SusD family nutrient uptake outer membrane protein n=1 Tax=Sphingobacterium tabacisoli TaxID=2044855 RepID=A0ABW5L770_9SPHI|nr:RagB/SusD family nutrient uptake outer membrane protein [Sphingobacterium tabacisoli]